MSTTCSSEYSTTYENAKYFVQFAYLAPALLLHIRILFVIYFQNRRTYFKESFFKLYSLDCMASGLMIISQILFTRILLYFPQLCHFNTQLLLSAPFIMDISYCSDAYLRAIKPVIHIFIGLNRMSCVIMPVSYSEKWADRMPLFITIIVIAPFFVMWNTLLSSKIFYYVYGGILINYTRYVSWASLSLFNFILIMLTVAITIITTSITIIKMSTMKKRLKSTERTLCIATALISLGFLFEGATQSMYAFFKDADWLPYVITYFQMSSYDVLNVGSPLIMILVSKQLRQHIFNFHSGETHSQVAVSVTLHSKQVSHLREQEAMSSIQHLPRHHLAT